MVGLPPVLTEAVGSPQLWLNIVAQSNVPLWLVSCVLICWVS